MKNSFKKFAVDTMNRTHGNYSGTSNHFCRIKLIVSSYPTISYKSCYKLTISTVADSLSKAQPDVVQISRPDFVL